MIRATRRRALTGAVLLPFTRTVCAQGERPVTLGVPSAPGGSNDVSARLLALYLQSLLG